MKKITITIKEEEVIGPDTLFREASVSLPILLVVWRHFHFDEELSITACYLEVAHLVSNYQSFRKALQRLIDKSLLELRPSKSKKSRKIVVTGRNFPHFYFGWF